MNEDSQTLIGKVISVSGNKLAIRLDDRIRSMMPIIDGIVYKVGQIGSFVKIKLGHTQVFAVVTHIGADAIPESLRENKDLIQIDNYGLRWISAVLMGECVGKKFEKGVLQIPSPEDHVHLVTVEDMAIIYTSTDDSKTISIGQISNCESLPALLDLDKLVSRHCAVLGSTGSGKSNAVSIILENIAKSEFKSSRILLIDPHGEYNETFKEYSRLFKINAVDKQNELYIPFWALPVNELLALFPGSLDDAKMDYVRSKILEEKIVFLEKMNLSIPKESISADSPIPFSIRKLWFDLYDIEIRPLDKNKDPKSGTAPITIGDAEKLVTNEYPPVGISNTPPFTPVLAKGIKSYLDNMKVRLLDQRFNFLFRPGELEPTVTYSCKSDFGDLIASWIGHDRPITILDLSAIPSEMMLSMAGTLIKIIYDVLFWGQNLPVGGRQQPLLIVLEEAHNYLKAGEKSVASRTVQKISKEGRKYGVGLMLATQRASELDETVLSQCGTIIALRMANSSDKAKVSGAIQSDLDSMVNLLPSLRTGEAIISGEAVRIPSRIKFDKITNAPKSSDPKVSLMWEKPRPDEKDYNNVINLWRSGKFK